MRPAMAAQLPGSPTQTTGAGMSRGKQTILLRFLSSCTLSEVQVHHCVSSWDVPARGGGKGHHLGGGDKGDRGTGWPRGMAGPISGAPTGAEQSLYESEQN